MKGQWGLIVGFFVALIIAIFAVINMEVVAVNYMFGTAEWPLVIVIISSVLMGSILVGGVGIYTIYNLKSDLKKLKLENAELRKKNPDLTKNIQKKAIPTEPSKNSNVNTKS